jgi:hypothetical protein
MHSSGIVGFSDADTAALAAIVSDVEKSQEVIAAAQAAQVRALARAGDLARKQSAQSLARVREHDMALRAIAAEVAGVMRTTDRSVQRQIDEATELVQDYPSTLESWEGGAITRQHVRVIVETGTVLPPEHRPAFEAEALARCAVDTPGRVRSELALLAERLHPRTLAERHRDARLQRGVRVMTLADGMSALTTTGPTVVIDAIYDRLTQQARSIIDARAEAAAVLRAIDTSADAATGESGEPTPQQIIASDTRTMDQLRADIVADTLLTAAPDADPTRTDDGPGVLGAIRAKVQIVVPALTLLGSDDDPAELVGRSPIDPDTARELACLTRSPWERILTHPVTGAVLHVDTYQRTAAMNRYLRARDQHCRFPGCRMPAIRCEVDHTFDHALGGCTACRNLAHLCQRHHSMKQFTAWRVRQLADGILEWTSPLGRTYTEHPPSLGVRFALTAGAPSAGDPSAGDPNDDDPPGDPNERQPDAPPDDAPF